MGIRFDTSGYFLHGINLDDWYPCWNLALSGTLTSPDFMASIEPGFSSCHQRIRDVPLEELRMAGLPRGMPTPRAVWALFAGTVASRGGHLGMGIGNTRWLPRSETDECVSRREVELAFEQGRREVAPEAPSRLSSLYLAEDSDVGRTHIRNMLGPDMHILRVVVAAAVRVHRADTRWYDRYCAERDPNYITNYWQSLPAGSDPATWEILLDGQIRAWDEEGLEYIKNHGAHRAEDNTGLFGGDSGESSSVDK